MIPQRTLLTGGQLLLLALAAYFAAASVNGVVAGSLRSRRAVRAADEPVPLPAPAKHPLSYYAAVTEKDIFNPPRHDAEAPAAAPVPELKAKLLGTAPGEAIESYAIIEDEGNKKQDLYRVGDKLQGRTVTKIEWDRVVLRHESREEVLKLADLTGRPPPVPEPVTTSGGIQKLSDTNFVIDRSEVDQAMENLNLLFTQIRAVPHFQDGKATGFRLFAIRHDSIFDKIGLKNGDIISKINGNELSDPARAMSLIQELRGEGKINVEVTRNREPTTLNYEIR